MDIFAIFCFSVWLVKLLFFFIPFTVPFWVVILCKCVRTIQRLRCVPEYWVSVYWQSNSVSTNRPNAFRLWSKQFLLCYCCVNFKSNVILIQNILFDCSVLFFFYSVVVVVVIVVVVAAAVLLYIVWYYYFSVTCRGLVLSTKLQDVCARLFTYGSTSEKLLLAVWIWL